MYQCNNIRKIGASQELQVVEDPPVSAGDADSIPGGEDPLEENMETHSSSLAWEIPWTEDCGRVRHD